MEKKIKLSPKQLSSLQQIQTQKQQVQAMFQDLNQKESLIVELTFEAASVDVNKVENIKLEGEFLVYNEKESKAAKKVKKIDEPEK